MKVPSSLEPLMECMMIDEVLYRLMSGKEAEVFVVRKDQEIFCAKVYKESNNRSFRQMATYTEGRKVRDSRQSRAMQKKSKFGRKETESEWQRAEVDALYLLADAGVRVPHARAFIDGVLLMEMICDESGDPAPRLHEVDFSPDQAATCFRFLVGEATRMLCAGIVHGDLSEFNVLLAFDGPVIIDFPQAVMATANNAFMFFQRDVNQLRAFFAKFAPEVAQSDYAPEIWAHFQRGKLLPDTPLTGTFQHSKRAADVRSVMDNIQGAKDDEDERRGVKRKVNFRRDR
jgi:RIO kinase 1